MKAGEEKEIIQGFPWVYDNEISHLKVFDEEKQAYLNYPLENSCVSDGSLVEVFSKDGGFENASGF